MTFTGIMINMKDKSFNKRYLRIMKLQNIKEKRKRENVIDVCKNFNFDWHKSMNRIWFLYKISHQCAKTTRDIRLITMDWQPNSSARNLYFAQFWCWSRDWQIEIVKVVVMVDIWEWSTSQLNHYWNNGTMCDRVQGVCNELFCTVV